MKTLMCVLALVVATFAFTGEAKIDGKRSNQSTFETERNQIGTYSVQVYAHLETETDQTILYNDMVVAENQKSHVSLIDTVADESYRFEIRVKKGRFVKGQETVTIEASIYKMIDESWILQSEPVMKMPLDSTGSIYMEDSLGLTDVELSISKDEPVVLTDQEARVLYDDNQDKPCCNVPCLDGSGRTLQCCSFKCQGCGTLVFCGPRA